MALPSFLKRKTPAAAPTDDAAIVQRARTAARRRLIGAAVLLAIGVIAFPLLFETQPRPIPVDIPIEIPRKDGLPPLAAPPKAARTSGGTVADVGARAVAEPAASAAPVVAAASVPAKPEVASQPAPSSAKPPSAEPKVPAAEPKAAAAPASAAVAKEVKARPEAAEAAPRASPASAADAADTARFVVQVGAFAEATAAREVRLKVEKLGMKTYTQVVETPQGRRIRVRVGPFASKAEADKTLARLKAATLPGAVLTL